MADPRRERDLAQTLDRCWDAVLTEAASGAAEEPDFALDPDLAATVRRARDLDTMPAPHPTFASTLWDDLMAAHVHTAQPFANSPLPVLGDEAVASRRLFPMPRAAAPGRLAAAILLFFMLAASVAVVLYPHRPRGDGLLPILALVEAPTATVDPIGGTVLLDLTLTGLPPMRTFGGIEVTDYPPGALSIERTPKFPRVFYIAAGPMTVIAGETPEPVKIIAPGASTTTYQLASGDEAILETGTTVVAPTGSIVTLQNDGTTAARQLSLISGLDAYGSQRDGATWRWGSVGMPQEIAPPVTIQLRQLTLNPSAALPIPGSGWGEFAAATLDADRGRELSFDADAGWRNTSIEPMQVYLLHLSSGTAPDPGKPTLDTP